MIVYTAIHEWASSGDTGCTFNGLFATQEEAETAVHELYESDYSTDDVRPTWSLCGNAELESTDEDVCCWEEGNYNENHDHYYVGSVEVSPEQLGTLISNILTNNKIR